MPSPYVKKLARETGKSVDEIESLWDKAKKAAGEHFKKSPSEFQDQEYAYTVGIVKKMVGLDEMLLDVSYFLESNLSASEFIEDVGGGGISGSFDAAIGKDPVIPPKDKDTPVPYKKKEDETPAEPEIVSPENDVVKDDDLQQPPNYTGSGEVRENLEATAEALDRMFDNL